MNNLKGFAFGILTSATFGLIPLFTLPLMAKGMQFDSILFYRFLFAALALAGIMAAKKESFHADKRDIPVLILLGFFYTASAMFLFWGYNFMSAGIATTLHFTYPVFVTLIMLLFFREKTSWITLMAIVLAICGVARLSIGEEEIRLSALGVFIVLLSALGYALYITTVNKFLAGGSTSRLKMGGRKLTFYVFIVSTALFAIKAGTNQGIQPIPDSIICQSDTVGDRSDSHLEYHPRACRAQYRRNAYRRIGRRRTYHRRMCRDIGFQRAFHPQSGSRHPAYHHCCNDDYPVQIDPGHITEIIQESGPFSGFEISPYNRRLTFIVLRACD